MHKLLVVVFLASCVAVDGESTESLALIIPRDPTCTELACGTNAASIDDGIVFAELDRSGAEPSRGGVKLAGATILVAGARVPVKLFVDGDQLYGIEDNGNPNNGYALVDRELVIDLDFQGDATHPPELFQIKLDQYSMQTAQLWAAAPAAWVPYYHFLARRTGEAEFKLEICRGNLLTGDPAWGGQPYGALVFQGEHYDIEHHTATSRPVDDPWFHVACAGTAAAKMHLVRHTTAGAYDYWHVRDPALATDDAERTAMLKAITGDFCGTGQSLTRNGTPLRWTDARGIMPAIDFAPAPPTTPPTIEAIFDEHGAVCLNEPRAAGYTRNDIVETCAAAKHNLPGCGFSPRKWQSRGYVLTARP